MPARLMIARNVLLLRIILRFRIYLNALTKLVIQDKVSLSLERTKAKKPKSDKAQK